MLPPYSCLWDEGAHSTRRPRPGGDLDVDVCVVGGGFTGLWTAWHLRQQDPSIRVAVLEAEHVGFGASGRNGGWVQTALPSSLVEITAARSAATAMRVHGAMAGAVDAIGAFAQRYAPGAAFSRAGQLQVARNAAQAVRLRDWVERHHSVGMTEDDLRWLSAPDVGRMVAVSGATGGYFTPHCAVVHPRQLVDGLARACDAIGVHIFESTRAERIAERRVETSAGRVRAAFVVRATEGYTPDLPGHHRALVPVFSLMIATEPLSDAVWREIGWRDRFTLSDGRHLVIYAQRTSDNRIAFGGRGAPYRYGSKTADSSADNIRVHTMLRNALVEFFPGLADVTITHRWGGALGVARDWVASVGLDRSSGLAWAGGYVGDGLGATHLAGQTLADLILGNDTDRVHLPWVGHRSRRWEPEPVRSLGIRAAARLTEAVDSAEAVGRRTRLRSLVLDRLT